MTNIFASFRRLLNRRQHKRYVVKNGTSAIISYDKVGEQNVQLIDVSDGGMAFVYERHQPDIPASGRVTIRTPRARLFSAPQLFSTCEIRFDTVSDVPVADHAHSPEQFWRRGVKFEIFEWMETFEKANLKDFINETKLCEA